MTSKFTNNGEMPMSLEYNSRIVHLAKELRKNATLQEKRLWYDYLATYPVRFQRQKVIDNFIADFYCHKAKLVIEIDGSQHYTPDGRTYDEARTEIIEKYGVKVIRFSNLDIDNSFAGVCYMIDEEIKSRLENI